MSSNNSTADRPLSPKPLPIKKQSSFSSFSSSISRTFSKNNLQLPTSPKASAKRQEILIPDPPPKDLNRQELKDFLLAQRDNPSLEGVVRLGNMCYAEIEGHGLHPRAPEMCHHAALLLEWANRKNTQLLTPTEQKNLGFSHYHAWCNSGIIAEVSD
jgi:hypothetical protein